MGIMQKIARINEKQEKKDAIYRSRFGNFCGETPPDG